MAETLTLRKRAAPPSGTPLPQSKKARQDPTPQESDAASSYSQSASDRTSTVDDDAATADTPPSPAPSQPKKKPFRPNKYHCTVDGCGRSFNRPCRLEEHLRSHNNERPFSCTYDGCDKTFIRQTHLNRHVRDEHENVREHVCNWPGCDKTFANATRLKRHTEAHESKFHCTDYPPCREVFRKHSTLQKHIRSAHLGQKKYQCPHIDPDTGKPCDQAYDSPSSLKAHEGRVHGGIKHYCTQCATDPDNPFESSPGFPTYTALQVHVKEAHPPTCEHCDLVVSTWKQLEAHIELFHSGLTLADRKKKFPCPYPDCESSFTRQGNLNMHIRHAHEDADKWICGETDMSSSKKDHIKEWNGEGCGRGFSSKGNLEEHIQTQHLGMKATRKKKKPAKDPNAPKKSRSREAKVPMATRLTGIDYNDATGRRITCLFDDCENRFYRDYDLQVHLEAVHGMDGTEAVEAIKERAADEGGNFWIGGLDEVMGQPMGAHYEWDEEDIQAQQELDRKAGIFNAGPPVNVHAAGLGDEPQHGEVYNAVWNYLHDQSQ
ncbi:Transcription factor IIIA [Lasiodiplodia theobromae]|uniref:Transcription factor IIIA n=1 Tax=Lasiodiplodia theobromae TaxID=45133 RepID=A0A5N5CXN1_9PEZI|nr:Transcription factor IIIA [Lasiodiplodia theobromae]